MTEQSSPLEAAAKAVYVRYCDDIPEAAGWWDSHDEQDKVFWRECARAAIAAYEAEQTTPDLAAALRAYLAAEHAQQHIPMALRADLEQIITEHGGAVSDELD